MTGGCERAAPFREGTVTAKKGPTEVGLRAVSHRFLPFTIAFDALVLFCRRKQTLFLTISSSFDAQQTFENIL